MIAILMLLLLLLLPVAVYAPSPSLFTDDSLMYPINVATASTYPCNIERRVINDHTMEDLPNYPVILVGSQSRDRNIALRQRSTRDYLLQNYGTVTVKLTSSNTYSHGLQSMTLKEYITKHVDGSSGSSSTSSSDMKKSAANETLYFFGNNYSGIWDELMSLYTTPPCTYCDVAGSTTIGIGGKLSGVSWHYHGPGFSESIIGRKRWFLVPPGVDETWLNNQPNATTEHWLRNDYNRIIEDIVAAVDGSDAASNKQLYECVIDAGEMLYFPTSWLHSTLNLDEYNFFVSLFIDTQLIKSKTDT